MVLDDLEVRTHSRSLEYYPQVSRKRRTHYLQCHELSRSVAREPDGRGAAATEFVDDSAAPLREDVADGGGVKAAGAVLFDRFNVL